MKRAIKILLIGFGSFIVLMIIVTITISIKSSKEGSLKAETNRDNVDSLVAVIKRDSLYDIRDIYYNPKDSDLYIAFTNKDHAITEHNYSTYYFNEHYKIDGFESIDGVSLFAYKKGESLSRGDYDKPLDRDSRRFSRLLKQFQQQYIYALNGSCVPLEEYIKKNMNDPDSYEHVKTWVEYAGDSSFTVNTRFRGKNAFGGKVLNELTAKMDINGNILNGPAINPISE